MLPPPVPRYRADDDHRFPFRDGAIERSVFRDGIGPAVLLMHELPGMSPACLTLASRIMNAGYTVYAPLFFGKPNEELTGKLELGKRIWGVCVAKEFACLATDRTSPITDWLRALLRRAHTECGGPGVGVIGMCFSGSFVLGMMLEDALLVPVMCQPALPFTQVPTLLPTLRARKRALGVDPTDLAIARHRARNAPILGFRFERDDVCPPERFDRLEREFDDNFAGVQIPCGKGTRFPGDAHSVLTTEFDDTPGDPTAEALKTILDRFASRLKS
jgi:dienelactone hydrolase